MHDYLVFTLAAPLASFGTVAVGERRPTWDRPSKSQTLGLIASALGIERADEAAQQALAASLGFAVRVDDPGQLASDYQTSQAAKEVEIRRRVKAFGPIRTRAGELACDDLKTILSRREFRTGSLYTIAVWCRGDVVHPLDEIERSLAAPVFAPFAGRKAFPLMLPMAPRRLQASDLEVAFARYDAGEPADVVELKAGLGIKPQRQRPIFTEAGSVAPDRVWRIEERRDHPESRSKWRFGLRTEVVLKPSEPAGSQS